MLKTPLLALAAMAASGLGHIARGETVTAEYPYTPGRGRRQYRRRSQYFHRPTETGAPGSKLAKKAAKGRIGMATLR